MREMKGSGIAWIGEIPDDWRIIRNKNAFTCSKELVGEKSELTQLLSLTTRGIKKKDINNAEGKLPESFDTYQFVKENDLVMCLFDLDCSAVFSGISPYNGMISPAYRVLSCKKCMEPKYADYWFQYISDGRKFNHYAKNIRYTLSYEEFSALPLLLPERNEQRRIADYLDRKCGQIDAIIARQQAVIEKLKAYKLSVITEAVTKGLNPGVPMKGSGVEWIGEIPDHWQLTKIKWVADTCSGGTPPSGDLSFYDGGINWVCSYDLHEYAIKCTQRTLSEEGAEIIAGKMQKPNSILIAMYGGSGTIGNSGILSCYARTNQAVCSVYFDEKLMNPKFALYQTIFMRKYWMYYAVGSRKDPNISQDTIRNMHYIIPPMQEQEAIVEWIESRINVVECIQRKKSNIIEKLADYKKSLIYEVVTGKKEV